MKNLILALSIIFNMVGNNLLNSRYEIIGAPLAALGILFFIGWAVDEYNEWRAEEARHKEHLKYKYHLRFDYVLRHNHQHRHTI